MPIRKAFKSLTGAAGSSNNPGLSDGRNQNAQVEPQFATPVHPPMVPVLLQPTMNQDIGYFYQVADGEINADESSPAPTFVLNLFRATDPRKKPAAERMILGQAKGAPFYALHATPSVTSIDEYNRLQIARHHPLSGHHQSASTVDILPKLDLGFKGAATIARIVSDKKAWSVVWTGANAEGDENLRNTVSVWVDATPSKMIVCFRTEGGWTSLDDRPPRGRVVAEALVHGPSALIFKDIGYMSFENQYPQFVSQSHIAHRIMDVLVSGLFVTMIYLTRRSTHVDPTQRAAPVGPSAHFPGAVAHAGSAIGQNASGGSGAALSQGLEDLLTCGICYRVMHHPVALTTTAGCLHSFCGACIVQLVAHNDKKCPHDRSEIMAVSDNRNLTQIIEQYLMENPDQRNSDQDIATMDRIYRPGQRVRF